MDRRAKILLLVLALLFLAVAALRLVVAPSVGSAGALALPADGWTWQHRSLRLGAGAIVGGSLALSGVLLQALLRNPLAAPGVLGLTSGAGLGVFVWIFASVQMTGAIGSANPPAYPAIIGAFGALLIVYALGQRRGLIEPVSLILIGVVVSVICSAGMMFLQHLLPAQGWNIGAMWMLGSISDDTTWARLGAVAGLTLIGLAISLRLAPAMDAAMLSDAEARSVGVRLGALRLALFAIAGALAAGAVLLAGPISFVGLVCPHAIRLLIGPSHRALVLGSTVLGASMIVLADAAVRLIDLGAGRMPIGVLTALIGGPLLLWLLRQEARRL